MQMQRRMSCFVQNAITSRKSPRKYVSQVFDDTVCEPIIIQNVECHVYTAGGYNAKFYHFFLVFSHLQQRWKFLLTVLL